MKEKVKERPILMKGEMVRATLADIKTQTRRVIKLPPAPNHLGQWEPFIFDGRGLFTIKGNEKVPCNIPTQMGIHHTRTGQSILCPHGGPCDRLWVREAFWNESVYDFETGNRIEDDIWYRADLRPEDEADDAKWKPSIFMPRWASRINLEIVDIRVQRVQDISSEDAIAEGIGREHAWDGTPGFGFDMGMWYRDYLKKGVMIQSPVESYRTLWDSINAKRGYGWDVNPWVWVIVFKRIA